MFMRDDDWEVREPSKMIQVIMYANQISGENLFWFSVSWPSKCIKYLAFIIFHKNLNFAKTYIWSKPVLFPF